MKVDTNILFFKILFLFFAFGPSSLAMESISEYFNSILVLVHICIFLDCDICCDGVLVVTEMNLNLFAYIMFKCNSIWRLPFRFSQLEFAELLQTLQMI